LPIVRYIWLRRGESAEFDKTTPATRQSAPTEESVGVLGNVLVYENQLVVEAFSRRRYLFARQMADRFFAGLVRFEGEMVVDMAQIELNRRGPRPKPSPDVIAVLQRFFEQHPEGLIMDTRQERRPATEAASGEGPDAKAVFPQKIFRKRYEELLDNTVPALDNKTPRQAAQDPAFRPRLLEFLKGHIHNLDVRNREEGLNLNIDWFLDELNVPELK